MVDEKFNKVINLIRFSAKQITKADEISRLKGIELIIYNDDNAHKLNHNSKRVIVMPEKISYASFD